MDHTLISRYFPELTEAQTAQFAQLGDLYKEWNDKINVVSRKDIDQIYERHILHSLAIAKVMDLTDKKILDVGTGGGFPGIPLAIMFPTAQFTLVDSIGKKITVVNAVKDALGLKNAEGFHMRAEKVKGSFDFVTSRAVTRMNKFLPWVQQKIQQDKTYMGDRGILALKGGDLEEEMGEIRRPYQEKDISDFYQEDFFETKKVIYIPF